MNQKHVLLASLLAVSSVVAQSAYAVTTGWVGTADYGVETVGPFNTYDLGTGAVLLKSTGANSYNGFYQSFVTNHELDGAVVSAPSLNSAYELTMVANFAETITPVSASVSSINVSGGTFSLYLDTTGTDHNYGSDSGFDNGSAILTGTIVGGAGSASSVGGMIIGATDINISVTTFDSAVFNPGGIVSAGGIFTLRLGSQLDSTLLGPITSVQGNAYNSGSDLLFAADGQFAMAVPEASTYAMMLVGLGLVGFMVRRTRMSV